MYTTLNYSLNFDIKKRNIRDIKFIIFHYTGMKKEIDAINQLINQKSKVSSHFVIDQNGILQYANNEIDTEWMLYVLDELVGNNILPGDLNNDQQINVLDVITMVNIILGETPTDEQFNAGELNGDGVINVLDVITLVSMILE